MNLLREYIRGIITEAVSFREVDSPLEYNVYGGVRRFVYCDDSVATPPDESDRYFVEFEKWRKRTKGGRKLKKPVLDEIIPGVSDVCIVGFLDFHVAGRSDDKTYWSLDYMKTRSDKQGAGVASQLVDEWFKRYPKEGDDVDFGKMFHASVGHLKEKISKQYPGIYMHGKVWY